MDDISNNLAISKKTLYQYFKDKDDVVNQTTKVIIDKEKSEFDKIVNEATDSLDELFNVSICLRRIVDSMNPSLLFDLSKYHPEAWMLYIEYKEEFIYKMIVKNLEKGIEEGYYREEIDAKILARLRVEEVQMCFDNRIFARDKYDFKDVQMQVFNHFLFGILTPQGKELYEVYQEKNTVK